MHVSPTRSFATASNQRSDLFASVPIDSPAAAARYSRLAMYSLMIRSFQRGVLALASLLALTPAAQAYNDLGPNMLIGRDLTDPEDDGDESCALGNPPTACGFAATFASNNEPGFSTDDSLERAFNVFDNSPGGGDFKWCCDGPSAGGDDPATAEDETGSLYVEARFADPIVLRAFTLTTGDDSYPDRDIDRWAVQGSVDGTVFTDIYRCASRRSSTRSTTITTSPNSSCSTTRHSSRRRRSPPTAPPARCTTRSSPRIPRARSVAARPEARAPTPSS